MPQTVLQASGVRKSFGRRQVLQAVSFSVLPGTLVGIVGENGSGKSTLLQILAGELKPDDGAVLRHHKIGYCPQTIILNEALTIDQHLDFFSAAYDSSDPQYIDHLIEKLGYQQYRRDRVSTLSGGTKQKLNLTLALMHNPELLLLDEPYQGFDWETYLSFWEIVTMLQKNDCAVVVISHLFFEQKRFDTLYRLQNGRLHLQEPAADKRKEG